MTTSRVEMQQHDVERARELNPHRALLTSLFHELFQTERSAEIHPPLEAARLGNSAPARALRAVSSHAASVRPELPELARRRGLPVSRTGKRIGDSFSWVRRHFTDGVMESERSYRATLLGIRHGVDLVKLIRSAAEAADDRDLVSWCTEWLSVREPLVEEVCAQLAWFGWHPESAIQHTGKVRGLLDRLLGRADRDGSRSSPALGQV
ncbi:hypothetical protein [Sandaracinus amylolyticus]|uniref:Uncharacterized protein n=1 Tax=Sandaracinus amylolyticus TaxID=927083 RepID=A0A0F6YGI6_9BACT|nr:hypothetical protein [Sandaracinus amylolyticus]AKF03997.1 hypothetical protein DB32_001146 [Sandaracinus amylolyticus]